MKNILFVFLLLVSCAAVHPSSGVFINVSDFDSVEDALDSLLSSNVNTLYFPAGNYQINSRILKQGITKDINFLGEPGAILYTDTSINNIIRLDSDNWSAQLSQNAPRLSDTIYVSSQRPIKKGDLITIKSDQVVESGWGTKEHDTHVIDKVLNDSTIILRDKLNFEYLTSEVLTIHISTPASFTFKGIDFVFKDADRAWGLGNFLTFRFSNVEFYDCNFLNENRDKNMDGAALFGCVDVGFYNCNFDGFRYASLVNACRDVSLSNSTISHCRHGLAPASWTINVSLTNIIGYNNTSTLDAHPSFNVVVDGIETYGDIEYPVCRSVGVTIKNFHFRQEGNHYHTYAYFGIYSPQLNQGFKHLAEDQILHFENGTWIPVQPGSFNGLVASEAKRITYRNVTTNVVGTWHKGADLIIADCTIGEIQNRGAKLLLVTNTLFDGSLYDPGDFVIRAAPLKEYGGLISNSRFVNYDKSITGLIGQVYNSRFVSFSNCYFGPINSLGWFHQNAKSDNFKVVGCHFDEVVVPPPFNIVK